MSPYSTYIIQFIFHIAKDWVWILCRFPGTKPLTLSEHLVHIKPFVPPIGVPCTYQTVCPANQCILYISNCLLCQSECLVQIASSVEIALLLRQIGDSKQIVPNLIANYVNRRIDHSILSHIFPIDGHKISSSAKSILWALIYFPILPWMFWHFICVAYNHFYILAWFKFKYSHCTEIQIQRRIFPSRGNSKSITPIALRFKCSDNFGMVHNPANIQVKFKHPIPGILSNAP